MRSRSVALRSTLAAALLASLGACVAEGPAPPRVDVPEPGASGAPSSARARPAQGARSTPAQAGAVRVTAAPSSSLPIPSSGPSASTPTGSFGSTYPSSPGGAPGAVQGADPSTSGLPGVVPSGSDLVDPAHVPAHSGNNAVNTLLAQADTARRAGNLDGALASAERALRIAPADPAVYYELSVLRMRRGEHAAAEQLARKGLSHQPDFELRQRFEDLLARMRSG